MPSVCAIIPMRNEEANARACLASLAELSYANLRIVIVDDCSWDHTVRIVEEWIAQRGDERFYLLHAPHEPPSGWVGKSFAVDVAIGETKSDLILIADADVRHAPMSLARSVHALEDARAQLLVRLPLVPLHGLGSMLSDFFLANIFFASRAARALSALPLSFGAYVLMERSWYERIGGFAAHRAFPESLPLARFAAQESAYALVRPAHEIEAQLYSSLWQAMRGCVRNINFSLVSPGAALGAFMFISFPLFMLDALGNGLWWGGAGLALWCALLAAYERACGRSHGHSIALGLLGPLNAALLAALSLAAVVRMLFGLSMEWRGRRMRVQ